MTLSESDLRVLADKLRKAEEEAFLVWAVLGNESRDIGDAIMLLEGVRQDIEEQARRKNKGAA